MSPSLPTSNSCMWTTQRTLSRVQAFPIIGPLVVSPIKAAISLIQFIGGFLCAVFLSAIGLVCCGCKNDCGPLLSRTTLISAAHMANGLASLGYSIGNIITLGLVSCMIEGSVFRREPSLREFQI